MSIRTVLRFAVSVTLLGAAAVPAYAQSSHERQLTITRHHTKAHQGSGVEYRDGGNEVVAWGGFSANGYGLGTHGDGEAARRAARNEAVRLRTGGVYGYGFDGLGGTFDNGDLNSGPGVGYNNPNYGNAYSSYVGYGGVPSNLAFGPGYASRHITDSDDFDSDADVRGPSPSELGFGESIRAAFEPND